MTQILLIGIGAGLAAALLFVAPIGGTSLALPLFAMTGVPIGIAGLGWTPIAGIVAAATGSVAILAFLSPLAAGVFLLLFGLPIAWLARLAGLSRQVDERLEWFPLGRLLVHAAAAAAIGLTGVGILIGYDAAVMASAMTEALSQWLAGRPDLGPAPSREEIEPFVRLNVAVLPYALSAIALVVVVFNLWLAGVVTRASGRLARPRERLWTVSLPVGAAIAFGAGLGASLLPPPLGEIGAVVSGAFGAALALVGLAVLHAMTIGNNARTALLTFTYLLLFLFGFPILLFAAIGLGETLLHLRARRFGGAPPAT